MQKLLQMFDNEPYEETIHDGAFPGNELAERKSTIFTE
jgi:hypothetical protein